MFQSPALLHIFTDSQHGGRKYMEDFIDIRIQKSILGNVEWIYLAIFDGHGGYEAAEFAKKNLYDQIINKKQFWSSDQGSVIKAIKEGFVSTHKLMWKIYGSWSKTATGLPSTAGTTATVALIKKGVLYVAHVGDSSAVIGTNDEFNGFIQAQCITQDHKPTLAKEKKRIEDMGGLVLDKAGVKRVAWRRPKFVQTGPVRRNVEMEDVPFLAVSRSLGDLWSYNANCDAFIVSPDPDVTCYPIIPERLRYLIIASDGLWNVVKYQEAINIVHENIDWVDNVNPTFKDNPASVLTGFALNRWASRSIRADNTSAILISFTTTSCQLPQSSVIQDHSEALVLVADSYSSANKADENHVFLTPEQLDADKIECMSEVMLTFKKQTTDMLKINKLPHMCSFVNNSTIPISAELAAGFSDKSNLSENATTGHKSKFIHDSFSDGKKLTSLKEHIIDMPLPTPPKTPCKQDISLFDLSKNFISPRSSRVLQRLRTRVSFPPLSDGSSICNEESSVNRNLSQSDGDINSDSLLTLPAVGRDHDARVLDNLPLNCSLPDMVDLKLKASHYCNTSLQNRYSLSNRKRRTLYDKHFPVLTVKRFCTLKAPSQKHLSRRQLL